MRFNVHISLVVLVMLTACPPCFISIAHPGINKPCLGSSDISIVNMATDSGSPADFMYSKPGNYSVLVDWYKGLEKNYSNYLYVFKANEMYSTGKIPGGSRTYDDYYVRLTNESLGFHKPEALFIGSPHGDETAGTISLYWFCSWILRHAFDPAYRDQQAPYLKWILDNREIYIEVCHNPYGFDKKMRNDYNGDDLNSETDYDSLGAPFQSVSGKTLCEFVAHHQIRIGADFYGGSRMLPYPWSSTHSSVSGQSSITSHTYSSAPPDFNYYDSSSLRLGNYMGTAGGYGGLITVGATGPYADVKGTASHGCTLSWAYGADVYNNSAESSYVQQPPYPSTGILWLSPELSPTKDPPVSQFGGDDTQGYGMDLRRFILHEIDLAQPYIKWQPGSVADDTITKPGRDLIFQWQVNGSMVVDHTQIVWGNDSDPANNPQYYTTDIHPDAGKLTGGTGWEGAFNGSISTPATYKETITMPLVGGDYYFVARAMVDQRYNNTLAPSVYGSNHTYLRLLKERLSDSWSQDITNATDGVESMNSRRWWYSPVIHVKVNGSARPFLEIDLTAPDGGEKWFTGRNYRINFTLKNGSADYNIDIYLSKDSGISWSVTILNGYTLSSPGSHYYIWTVPFSITNCSTCRVKTTVQDKNTDVATDQSIGDFEIIYNGTLPTPPIINVIVPNGGEKWFRGDQCSINWSLINATPPYRVSIYMSNDGGASFPYIIVIDVPQATPGNGTYIWTITTAFPATPIGKIRVEAYDAFDTFASDDGDSIFEIADRPIPPKFESRVLSPNGGENYSSGLICCIRWATKNGTAPVNVTLEYSTTGSAGPFVMIGLGVNDTGSCDWIAPSLFSNDCYVRVTAFDLLGNTSKDLSDSAFTVSNYTPPVKRGSITGTVNDSATSENLTNAHVSMYYSSNSTLADSTVTNINGSYLFNGVIVGTYDLRFQKATYKLVWSYNIEVTDGNTTYANKSLEKGEDGDNPPSDTNNTKPMVLSLQYAIILVIGIIVLIAIIAAIASSRRKKKDNTASGRKFAYIKKAPVLPSPSKPPPPPPQVHPPLQSSNPLQTQLKNPHQTTSSPKATSEPVPIKPSS